MARRHYVLRRVGQLLLTVFAVATIMFVLFLPLGIVALALWVLLKVAGSLR